jgi:hypothetical protein
MAGSRNNHLNLSIQYATKNRFMMMRNGYSKPKKGSIQLFSGLTCTDR